MSQFSRHLASVACTGALVGAVLARAQAPARVDFQRQVQPIFRAHCYACHGPARQLSGLRLDRRQDAMRGGTYRDILPGHGDTSRLYLRLMGAANIGLRMPPGGPLSAEEIRTIRDWMDQGAVWPDAAAGETPAPAPDPAVVRRADQALALLRQGDAAGFERLLADDPPLPQQAGADGATPLMQAALYGSAAQLRLLLAHGADANAHDADGAAALMWAADDLEKTRVLVAAGADVNARSADGQTPLAIASRRSDGTPVVALLLAHGAALDNSSALVARAAAAGNLATLQLLLAHAPAPAVTPAALAGALASGCDACFDRLVAAANPEVRSKALSHALADSVPPGNNAQAWAVLLAHGADPQTPADGGSAASLAARADQPPPGMSPNRLPSPVAPDPAYAALPPAPPVTAPYSLPAAIARALPPLQASGARFLARTGCVSCHSNSLTAITVHSARAAGFAVDEPAAQAVQAATASYLAGWSERLLQGTGLPGASDTVAFILMGMAESAAPASPASDAMARYLKDCQLASGAWVLDAERPPLESNAIEVAAAALRGMLQYAPPGQRAAYGAAAARAAAWLAAAQPHSTDAAAFRLFGLQWSGSQAAAIPAAARSLLQLQRADGGWAQLPDLASDAFATGEALVALHQGGGLAAAAPAYQRGVQYLLRTQLSDGSWWVRSRAVAIQPALDSGFPHGRDQWISAAATNWATLALTAAAAH